jgi:hypothetical protein
MRRRGRRFARPAVPARQVHTADMAVLVPVAHAGHWLWVLYLPPILIVAGSILRSRIVERRKKRDD